MKKFLIILLIALFAFPILSNSKEFKNKKYFACKLVMNNGQVFQTYLLGTDWKEISQSRKTMVPPPKTFEIIDFCFTDQDIYLEISADANKTLNLQVYSIDGTVHYENKIYVQSGNNYMNIKIPNNYYKIKLLTVSDNYNIKTIKFIK